MPVMLSRSTGSLFGSVLVFGGRKSSKQPKEPSHAEVALTLPYHLPKLHQVGLGAECSPEEAYSVWIALGGTPRVVGAEVALAPRPEIPRAPTFLPAVWPVYPRLRRSPMLPGGGAHDLSGWLYMRSQINRAFQRHYFRLKGSNLSYYESATSPSAKGEVSLVGAICGPPRTTPNTQFPYGLWLSTPKQSFVLGAKDLDDLLPWVEALLTASFEPTGVSYLRELDLSLDTFTFQHQFYFFKHYELSQCSLFHQFALGVPFPYSDPSSAS